MRTLHNTATTPARPIGISTNTSMAGNMIYTLFLAVYYIGLRLLKYLQRICQVCAVDTSVDGQGLAIPCSSTKSAEAKVRTEETINIG